MDSTERRRYPRLEAPVFYRPAGLSLFHHSRRTADISLGGMRVLTDDRFRRRQRLECDILLPGGTWLRFWTRIAWVRPLTPPAHALYEIGLEFVDMADVDLQRLASVFTR